jgi:hypothetical protein
MGFNSSATRARDSAEPLCLRVACLRECLVRFNLFGFHETRERLYWMVGASVHGWTPDQVTIALEPLSQAKSSWSRYADLECSRQRAHKREHRNARRAQTHELFADWMDGFLQAEQAELWLVARLGNCDGCGHRLALHTGRGACRMCRADRTIEWGDECRIPLPPPR